MGGLWFYRFNLGKNHKLVEIEYSVEACRPKCDYLNLVVIWNYLKLN